MESELTSKALLVSLPLPAIAANVDYSFPEFENWSVVGGIFGLSCDANAANRNARIQLYTADTLIYEQAGLASATAGQSWTYVMLGYVAPFTSYEDRIFINLPTFPPAYKLRLKTRFVNLQAGDRFTAINLVCQRGG